LRQGRQSGWGEKFLATDSYLRQADQVRNGSLTRHFFVEGGLECQCVHTAIFADLQETLNAIAIPGRTMVDGSPEPAQWRLGHIFKLQFVYSKFRKNR
jgi:hypothetical protein